ncbi:hypothetical protein A3F66_04565 [candidate division TM6 bacterium RIFCSPHIGHO2_12_FULL_32_22]|nr:MAG: hypothetical protein A3F66_04565 [candidate division TM6 bacterium RIFCSPHIGHO2_12_FULL_32_22]
MDFVVKISAQKLLIFFCFISNYPQDLELAIRNFKKYISDIREEPRLFPEINGNNWIAKMLKSLTQMSEMDINFYIDENIKNFDSDLSRYLRMVRLKLLAAEMQSGIMIRDEPLRNYLSSMTTKSLAIDIKNPDSFINKYFYELDSRFLTKPGESVSGLRYLRQRIGAIFRRNDENDDGAGPAE